MTLSDAVKTVTWLRQLLHKLIIRQSLTIIFQDSTGTIECANAGPEKYFSRRNYIDFRHNYVVSLIEGGQIVLK